METKDQILETLLGSTISRCQELLFNNDEFYPVCFFFKDEDISMIAIDDIEDPEKYWDALCNIIEEQQFESYVIGKDVYITSGEEEKTGIELIIVVDGVEYEIMYMEYWLDDQNNYKYADLKEMEEL